MRIEMAYEKIINVVLTLVEATQEMTRLYQRMPEIINHEQNLIRESDYANLFSYIDIKVNIAAQIEKNFDELNEVARDLLRLHRNFFITTEKNVAGLSHCFEMLQDFKELIGTSNLLVENTLTANLLHFEKAIAEFNTLVKSIKPALELNKMIMTTIANNYQESQIFWRELAEGRDAPYDAQGLQKSTGRSSSFVAKA